MGEPIAEVGYLAGICAHDGTAWKKLKIDAEGRLEVSVTAGHKYIDRGDPDAFDFDQDDLTMDGLWHVLDLSDIIVDSDAVLVHLFIAIQDDAVGNMLTLREYDNDYAINKVMLVTQAVDNWISMDCQVTIDPRRIINYIVTSVATGVAIAVRGWWRPVA